MFEELLQIPFPKAVVKIFEGLGLCSPYPALGRFGDPGNEKDEKSERLGGGVALSLTSHVTLYTVRDPHLP